MSGVLSWHQSVAPSTPDNWLGGMGNWSNPADWSAGEPGSGSDVTINTGNDHVNLDVSATINSLTLGGSTGASQLTGSSGNNLTIAGALTVNSTGTLSLNGDVSVNGQFDNRGTVDLRYGSGSFGSLNNYSGAVFRAGADTVLGNVSSDGIISVVSLGQNEPPVSFAIGGNLITGGLLNVAGSGGTGASASAGGNINNTRSGIIEVDTLGSLDSASITNAGLIRTGVQGTGGDTVRAGTLSNIPGGTILLGGVGDTGQFGYVNNGGEISIANGATLIVGGAHVANNALPGFLNSGTVLIAQGGTLVSPLTYSQTAGQTTVDGTLLISGHSNVLFSGGTVYGNDGDIRGNTFSNAAFNIGDGPMTIGQMMITGNYTQGANGSLYVDIASLTQYDRLNISGHALLNGTLYVDLLNGYVPQIGNMFDVVNYSSGSGTFSMVIGLPINGQEHFVLEYNSTNLTLDVVAGPDMEASTGHSSSSGHSSPYFEPYIMPGSEQAMNLAANSNAGGLTTPEPASMVLLGSGILGTLGVRRKKLF